MMKQHTTFRMNTSYRIESIQLACLLLCCNNRMFILWSDVVSREAAAMNGFKLSDIFDSGDLAAAPSSSAASTDVRGSSHAKVVFSSLL